MPRQCLAVFDCVTLVQSVLSETGPAARCVDYPRDPDDEPYLNLAIEAGAEFLVTRDRDLLDLMRWDREEGRTFQRRFPKLKNVDPVTFLKLIEP